MVVHRLVYQVELKNIKRISDSGEPYTRPAFSKGDRADSKSLNNILTN